MPVSSSVRPAAANRQLKEEVEDRVDEDAKAVENEQMLKQFIEAMAVGVFVIKADGTTGSILVAFNSLNTAQ